MKLLKIGLVLLAAIALFTLSLTGCDPDDKDPCAVGHIWGDWTETTPATCTAEGVETRTCTNNATHTETRAIPALGHNFVNGVCTRCNAPDPSYTPPPPPCNCDPKAHLGIDETCSCGGTGCTCTLQVYTTLDGVPVYRKGAAIDMTDAIAKLQEAYDDLGSSVKPNFSTKIARIILIPDSNDRTRIPEDGKWIIELGANRSSASMMAFLSSAINDPVETPTTRETFTIGTVDFIFEYNRTDTTSWPKLETAINTFINSLPTNDANATALNNLAVKADRPTNAPYKIVADYSESGKAIGFTVIDGQTLKVGSEYLKDTTIGNIILRNAFIALEAEPWPLAMNFSRTTRWG